MACCDNTLDLGCINHCNQLSFGEATISGTYNGVFTSGNIQVTQQITVTSGNPFIFDMTLLNEQMSYTLVIYNSDNEQITLTINSVEYNCFSVKTVLDGVVVPFVPVEGCTPMCKEIYDPEDISSDAFNYNNMHTGVSVDGVTITGSGTIEDPLTATGGGGGAIDSVNGKTGVVVLDADDINETVNRYWLTSALKAAYDGVVTWISTNGSSLINHLSNNSNPHSVTATQIGLGSVNNTSDADKPISNAQQTEFNTKTTKVSITEVTSSRNILSTDYGNILLIGANITLTVPTGLPDNFICNFDVLPTFTLTLVFSGTTVTGNAGLTIAANKMATLYKRGATETYRLKGETA